MTPLRIFHLMVRRRDFEVQWCDFEVALWLPRPAIIRLRLDIYRPMCRKLMQHLTWLPLHFWRDLEALPHDELLGVKLFFHELDNIVHSDSVDFFGWSLLFSQGAEQFVVIGRLFHQKDWRCNFSSRMEPPPPPAKKVLNLASYFFHKSALGSKGMKPEVIYLPLGMSPQLWQERMTVECLGPPPVSGAPSSLSYWICFCCAFLLFLLRLRL